MKKRTETIIDDIIQIMKQNSIFCNDITSRMRKLTNFEIHKRDDRNKAPFDLLCEIGGVYRRVPFDIGKRYEVLGLFPTLSDEYILVEQGDCRTRMVNEYRIAPLGLFEKINKNLKEINEILMCLNKKKIEGFYFINKYDKCIKSGNPVVNIYEKPEVFNISSANADFCAKVLYYGLFEPLKNLK